MPTVRGTDAAVYQGRRRKWTPENGTSEERVYKGTASKVAGLFNARAAEGSAESRYTEIESDEINGRGNLIVRYVAQSDTAQGQPGDRDDTIEELYAVDVVNDIRQHPAFQYGGSKALYAAADPTAEEIATVKDIVERANGARGGGAQASWSTAQTTLYRMLIHGMDSYLQTGFIYRQTVYTTRRTMVRASFAGINKVVNGTEPGAESKQIRISSQMSNLLESLPAGEWLKKPTTAEYLGKGKWRISLEYQWAEKWHRIYGGTLGWGP